MSNVTTLTATACPVCWIVGPCDCDGVPATDQRAPAPPQPRAAPTPLAPRPTAHVPDPGHPIAKAATALAGDWPLLLATAGSVQAPQAGTIGRQSNVHGIPGGTDHHSLTRETRDALADYAEQTRDAAGLEARLPDVDPRVNAELLAVHADTAAHLDPLPCTGHARSEDDTAPRWHATVEQHLACIAHRVRLKVEPAGQRVLVGLCPSPLESTDPGLSAQMCEQPLRANAGHVRCVNGHVHDTATIRDLAVQEASKRVHTLRDVARMSPTLWGRRIKYEHLWTLVRRHQLVPVGQDPTGKHLVSVQDVAAVVIHGRR